MNKEIRYKLVIGKFRVIKREKHFFVLDMDKGGLTLTISIAKMPVDVRLGDILTVYTEVLAHAQPGSASEQ